MLISHRTAAILAISVACLLIAFSASLGVLAFDQTTWLRLAIVGGVACGGLMLLSWNIWRPGSGRRSALFILSIALVARLLLFPTNHELSDDAARYHWDGKLISHGINPYLFAPAEFMEGENYAQKISDALPESEEDANGSAQRESRVPRHRIDSRINHPTLPTCYPPLAQLIFAAAYRLTPGSLVGFRILSLLAELVCWILLLRELGRRSLPSARLLLLAWAPLMLIEGYLPGHTDTLGLPLMALLIVDLDAKRAWRAGLWLALAALIKPLPLIFLPALIRQLGWRLGILATTAIAAILVAFYLPFAEAGGRLFSSTVLMAQEWSFGGGIGALIERLLPREFAHLVSALLIGVVAVGGAWRGKDLGSMMITAIIGLIAFAPTLFPWYLIWILPLLVLRPNPAVLAFCLLAPLSEWVQIDFQALGVWSPPLWPQLLQHGAFLGVLLLGSRRFLARRII